MITIIKGKCEEILPKVLKEFNTEKQIIFVSDPPFNIGYKYNSYKDMLEEKEYYNYLSSIFKDYPSVIVHYPEKAHRLSIEMKKEPKKVVSWVYNSNTAKQHRDICFYDIKPDFRKVLQPYKNLNDKRIIERINKGKLGAKLYDWWEIQQVKNVSKEKTQHPCQMPLEVMKRIIGILPENSLIIDPFMGSGTTGVACQLLNRDFIGIEMDDTYFNIAKKRIEGDSYDDSKR